MIGNASQLRKDVYRLLDRVLATGQPLEVTRNGRLLRIVPVAGASRLDPGEHSRLPLPVRTLLDTERLAISPMVHLSAARWPE